VWVSALRNLHQLVEPHGPGRPHPRPPIRRRDPSAAPAAASGSWGTQYDTKTGAQPVEIGGKHVFLRCHRRGQESVVGPAVHPRRLAGERVEDVPAAAEQRAEPRTRVIARCTGVSDWLA